MPHTEEQAASQSQDGAVQVEDRVSQCVTMYPVFCTANISPESLDEFLEQSYHGHFAMVDDGDVGAFACVLQTEDLASITHASRAPMPAFESPFLGWTEAQVRQWMKANPNDNFASCSFAIMDEETISKNILRVGCMLEDEDDKEDERMLLVDFFGHMYCRVPLEMATVSWFDEERVGTDRVFDRKYIENGLQSEDEDGEQ